MGNYSTLGDICSRFSSGKSISADKIRDTGKYPVYGGNGVRGYANEYNFSGECAIIGRQGAYCGNVRYYSGKAYMTEHAIVACAKSEYNTRYFAYKLSTMKLESYQGQSAQPGLSVNTLSKICVEMPDNTPLFVTNSFPIEVTSHPTGISRFNSSFQTIFPPEDL